MSPVPKELEDFEIIGDLILIAFLIWKMHGAQFQSYKHNLHWKHFEKAGILMKMCNLMLVCTEFVLLLVLCVKNLSTFLPFSCSRA